MFKFSKRVTIGLIVFILLVIAYITSRADAQDRYPVEKAAYCRLMYDYDQRDGILTCEYGQSIYSFYPHSEARKRRRLPRGMRLIVVYVDGTGCGEGCWKRIYFAR